jgi:hypothetical protein
MINTPGSEMYELIVESKAQELVELLRSVSPELRAAVSKKDADEAMLDAFDELEKDAPSALTAEIVRRARALVAGTTTLN